MGFQFQFQPVFARMDALVDGLWLTLQLAGIGILCGALLGILLNLHRPFAQDYDNGALEQLLVSPHPLPLLVGVKLGAHWFSTCVPLILASPVLALQFGLSPHAIGILVLSLLLGTPTLALVGGLGAALTLGLRPEALRLDGPGAIAVPGRVTEVDFLGAVIRVRVAALGTVTAMDMLNHRDAPPPAVGDTVTLTLDPADLHVIGDRT